jgi:hypothetical protein
VVHVVPVVHFYERRSQKTWSHCMLGVVLVVQLLNSSTKIASPVERMYHLHHRLSAGRCLFRALASTACTTSTTDFANATHVCSRKDD